MISTYYQVEFYSQLEQKWVPLFAREKTATEAKDKAEALLPDSKRRVVRVTMTTEVMSEVMGEIE